MNTEETTDLAHTSCAITKSFGRVSCEFGTLRGVWNKKYPLGNWKQRKGMRFWWPGALRLFGMEWAMRLKAILFRAYR